MEKSYEVLRDHAKDYATRIHGSTIQKEAALWSYYLYLLPKLTFPIVALTLSVSCPGSFITQTTSK
jgi:hypothetical protein